MVLQKRGFLQKQGGGDGGRLWQKPFLRARVRKVTSFGTANHTFI